MAMSTNSAQNGFTEFVKMDEIELIYIKSETKTSHC